MNRILFFALMAFFISSPNQAFSQSATDKLRTQYDQSKIKYLTEGAFSRRDCQRFSNGLKSYDEEVVIFALKQNVKNWPHGSGDPFKICNTPLFQKNEVVWYAADRIPQISNDADLMWLNTQAVNISIPVPNARIKNEKQKAYLKRAAELGNMSAQREYGIQLMKSGDIKSGKKFLELASDQGDNKSQDILAKEFGIDHPSKSVSNFSNHISGNQVKMDSLFSQDIGTLSSKVKSAPVANSPEINGILEEETKKINTNAKGDFSPTVAYSEQGTYSAIHYYKPKFLTRVNVETLNVRAGPSTADRIIETLPFGHVVQAYAREGDWIMISNASNKAERWVYLKMLDPNAKPKPSRTTTKVSARRSNADPYIPIGTQKIRFQTCKANIFRAANERRVKPVVKIDTSLMYLARIPVAKNNYKEYDSVICSQPDGNMTVTRTRL